MPGFTTHYLFGVNNLKKLKQSMQGRPVFQSIAEHKTVFQLGLQGPDIFFYHPASQFMWMNPGSIAHTRWTGDFLRCLIKAPALFWKTDDQRIAQAYAAGFIGHYILDVQIHPYVYYRTGTGDQLKKKGYAKHIALESDIDACLLMRYAKRLPSEFPGGRTIAFDAHTRAVTAVILYYAYNTIFPELALTKQFLSKALRSMQIGTMLTYNPHNYKRQALGAVERLVFGRLAVSPVIPSDGLYTSVDPLNLRHRQWRNPWKPQDCVTSSVPQMIKKASGRYQKALLQLDGLYEAEPFEDRYDFLLGRLCRFLGQQSFHSGLTWTIGEY